jgi:hypothetical protein
MRRHRLIPATGLALVGTALAIGVGQAAPLPAPSAQLAPERQTIPTGEREAAVAGALVGGGALGALLGSTLPRPAPPPVIVEEPVERVVVERRPSRRIVEVEEDAPPQVVEECVTRRTRVYDPDSDEMIVRKERSCR